MGLAPIIVEEIFEIIRQLNQDEWRQFSAGRAERQPGAALMPTTAMCWRTAASRSPGPAAELAARDDVKEFYLGGGIADTAPASPALH